MSDWSFVRRVLIVIALGSLAAAVWMLADLLLMVFGAVLVAVVLRTLMNPIMKITKVSEPVALAIACVSLIAAVAAMIVPIWPQLVAQTTYLAEQLPPAFQGLIDRYHLGTIADAVGTSAIGGLMQRAVAWGTAVFGALAGLVLILFGGIYFAAAPETYRQGLLKLTPAHWQSQIAATLTDAGTALSRWLRAQGVAMIAVGALTAIGMAVIGVPSALALGLIAGLAEFVPILGPILGAIPAVLLASTLGPEMMLWAIGVAFLIQQFESSVIMPYVVGRAVELPAAVGMFAVVAIGVVFGPLGLIFGYPLAVVIDVAVKRLYVRETLGKRVSIPEAAPE